MLTESELAQLRTDQEALMPDTCVVTRPAQGDFDADVGSYETTAPEVYEGPCRVMPLAEDERTVLFGDRAMDVVAFKVTLPFNAAELQDDDLIEVTESADAQLVGTTMVKRHVVRSSIQTARRIVAEVVE